jgi:hypothetical protein
MSYFIAYTAENKAEFGQSIPAEFTHNTHRLERHMCIQRIQYENRKVYVFQLMKEFEDITPEVLNCFVQIGQLLQAGVSVMLLEIENGCLVTSALQANEKDRIQNYTPYEAGDYSFFWQTKTAHYIFNRILNGLEQII